MDNQIVRTRVRWLAAGALFLWLSSAFFTVQEEEYAVVLFFGRPVRMVSNSGLKLKFPLPVNTVARVDRRLLVYDTIATEYLTRDKKNIVAQCYAVWKVTDPAELLRRCGDRLSAEQKLDEHLSSALGAAFGQQNFDNLVNEDPEKVQIDATMKGVEKAVNEVVADRKYGIQVASIHLTRLSYPDATLDAVFKRMRAERKAIAENYRAEGTRLATGIRSEADRRKTEILATAQAQADRIRGQAEQDAARIFSNSYRGNPAFWRYWRKLQAMEKVIDKDTTIYMTPDVELFSPLVSPPPAR
ncbi:MAG: protease modulator HflC [Fimbriimonadaceae bacterium]|nr:protease modulator HflC [Fimbriimonadaceae bacterium]